MPLGEGEVGSGHGSIDYAAVTSCLTVTCLLDDGSCVGGHLSLMRKAGALDSTEVLPAMVSLIPQDRTVLLIHLAGELATWNPGYFTTPLMDDAGESNYKDQPNGQLPEGDCSADVAAAFGVDASVVSSEDQTGAFTITP
jgi:hypothetical protein